MFSLYSSSYIKLLILIQVILIVVSRECIPRDFGKGSIVCVCNVTHCDDLKLDRMKTNEADTVTIVESTKSGKRFYLKNVSFKSAAHFKQRTHSQNYIDVTIDRTKKKQTLIGFGGSFTDSATINIKSLPQALEQRLIEDYYSENGLEYNMGRIPIGGTDFSTRAYAYNEFDGDYNLTRFALSNEDLEFKIPAVKYAEKVSKQPVLLFASSWSAPKWMKTSRNICGGTLRGKPGGRFYKIWADYNVKFLEAYRSLNITLWGMTAGNEPTQDYYINSMNFSPETQRDFLKLHLIPKLEQHGYTADKFKLMIVDTNIQHIMPFAEVVFNDSYVESYVSGIAFHWYFNRIFSLNVVTEASEKYRDKLFLSTEACAGWNKEIEEAVSLGNWTRAEAYAFDIIQVQFAIQIDLIALSNFKVLNHGAQAWVDWNLALDIDGGPSWINNTVDAPIIVNAEHGEYYKNPMFYVLGHFSKFIPRSSVRIGFEVQKSILNNAILTAFETPQNNIALVVLNPNEFDVELVVRDAKYGFFSVELLANSIQTFIWK
ncbi:glucosylceramidase-like protein [Dinothrombium tinctorium]|uniref:Glucosylceramidase n=1 Tax=Dinothrombium tinctorium TaxID=1965070 RepID=A0A3S3PMD9_9ACAR|nr:glucosylceramidase-like protein [Dinothrombium tinctorium]